MSIDLSKLNIEKIIDSFAQKEFNSTELVKEYLKNIEKDNTNSFITINDKVLEQAQKADQERAEGNNKPLLGIPLAIKDLFCTKNMPTTGASKILKNYTATYTATAVERLEEAGMIIIGKTNCDEFAMGSTNENSYFGPVLNPVDNKRVPGGSSGGSAVSVAANLAPVALGTDTGGSIRQPASFCGVVGLKPSYGRVSRYGSMAMTSSLDQIGPLGKTVKDTAYLLEAMAGYDEKDATSSQQKVDNYIDNIDQDIKKIRIGIPQEYYSNDINKEVKEALEKKIKELEKDGFEIKEVSLPNTDYALAAYYLLMPAEVSSNLARFDGLLYGLQGKKDYSLEEWYTNIRGEGFGAEAKRRIMLGNYILSAGYYDAYYKKAQKVRTLIKKEFAQVFQEVDILLTPVTPTTAYELNSKRDPLEMYLSDIFTVAANIGGLCGLSLPIAKDQNNLPIGLQLLGQSFQENKLFLLGNYIENNNK